MKITERLEWGGCLDQRYKRRIGVADGAEMQPVAADAEIVVVLKMRLLLEIECERAKGLVFYKSLSVRHQGRCSSSPNGSGGRALAFIVKRDGIVPDCNGNLRIEPVDRRRGVIDPGFEALQRIGADDVDFDVEEVVLLQRCIRKRLEIRIVEPQPGFLNRLGEQSYEVGDRFRGLIHMHKASPCFDFLSIIAACAPFERCGGLRVSDEG